MSNYVHMHTVIQDCMVQTGYYSCEMNCHTVHRHTWFTEKRIWERRVIQRERHREMGKTTDREREGGRWGREREKERKSEE